MMDLSLSPLSFFEKLKVWITMSSLSLSFSLSLSLSLSLCRYTDSLNDVKLEVKHTLSA